MFSGLHATPSAIGPLSTHRRDTHATYRTNIRIGAARSIGRGTLSRGRKTVRIMNFRKKKRRRKIKTFHQSRLSLTRLADKIYSGTVATSLGTDSRYTFFFHFFFSFSFLVSGKWSCNFYFLNGNAFRIFFYVASSSPVLMA